MRNFYKRFFYPAIFFLVAWIFFSVYNYFKFRDFAAPLKPALSFFSAILNIQSFFFSKTPSLIIVLIMCVISYRIGGILFKIFNIETELDLMEKNIYRLATGFGALGYSILFAGLAGLLYKIPLTIFFLILFAVCLWKFPLTDFIFKVKPKVDLISLFILIILSLFIVLNFIMVYSPEIFYDALVYHLAVPKIYLEHNRIINIPYIAHSNFPSLQQMLYLTALIQGDETTAKMLHFIMGLSTLMLIYCGVSKSFKLKYSGLTAVLFFYSQDTVSFNSWHGGNDVASTFFFTAALSAALNLSRKNKIEFFYISSIFLGLTMGVKYTAIFSVAGLFAVLSFYLFKMPDLKFKRVSICLLKSAAIIFLIMAPWFLKNFWNTGNPVYPFLSDVFNNENLAETGVSKNILNMKSKIFSFSFQKFFYSFWDLTMSNSGGGILFLAFLPLAVLVFVRRETNAAILLFGFGVSYFFWYAGGLGDYRLLMPATVILSAITSFCVCLTAEKNKIIFIPAFFIILLSFFFNNLMLFENIRVAEYFQKKISLSDYLSKPKMLFPRYCYKTIEWANSNLDSKSKIMLVGESRGYYIKNKYAGYSVELNKQPLMEFIKNAVDANDLYEKIRQSGITHLLINYWEAMRVNPSYNTFYWNRKDRIVFDEFWKKHISLEYFKHGSFLYKINASVAKGKSPLNLLEELEKNKWDKSRILNIYYKNREYDYMIDEYEFLQTVGFETGQMISEIKKLKKYYCCK